MNTSLHLTPEDARRIAREAYTYGFPMVECYKTLYKQALDPHDPEYQAPFNQIGHAKNVATSESKQFVTPNADTPYSYIWADLRAEPIVLTLPAIEKTRYYSAQLVDLYTHNFAYLGTRAFGNDGGDYLIAGPFWEGETPQAVRATIRSETEFCYVFLRVQLFNSGDLHRVHAIQAGMQVQTLSQYLGQPAPKAAAPIDWPKPSDGMTETPAVFKYLNFLLRFAPTHPTEERLMTRFARLQIGAGLTFQPGDASPEIAKAIEDGIADFWNEDFAELMRRVNAGQLTSAHIFGTREFLKNNYLYRFLGARVGIFGNSGEEAVYPPYFVDADGNRPDGAQSRYTLRFEHNRLPPANAFWSITMYDGKTQFLVHNRLNRYLVNSTMLNDFCLGADGSLTLYIQRETPGAELEPNWLPAPDGPFYCILRIYMPGPEVLNGAWTHPPLHKAL